MTNPGDTAIFVVGVALIVIAVGVFVGLRIKEYLRKRRRPGGGR